MFSINWCFSRRELLICALRSFFYCRFLMTLLPGRTHCSTIHFCLTFCSFMTPFVLLLQQNVMNVKQMVSLNLIPARELVEQRVSFFLLNFDLFFSWFFHFFRIFFEHYYGLFTTFLSAIPIVYTLISNLLYVIFEIWKKMKASSKIYYHALSIFCVAIFDLRYASFFFWLLLSLHFSSKKEMTATKALWKIKREFSVNQWNATSKKSKFRELIIQ